MRCECGSEAWQCSTCGASFEAALDAALDAAFEAKASPEALERDASHHPQERHDSDADSVASTATTVTSESVRSDFTSASDDTIPDLAIPSLIRENEDPLADLRAQAIAYCARVRIVVEKTCAGNSPIGPAELKTMLTAMCDRLAQYEEEAKESLLSSPAEQVSRTELYHAFWGAVENYDLSGTEDLVGPILALEQLDRREAARLKAARPEAEV